MGALCSVSNPAGLNQSCLSFIAQATHIEILEKGTPFALDSANVKTTQLAVLRETLKGLILPLTEYTNDTDDPDVQTTPMGQKMITSEKAPSITAYVNVNPCDYKELLNTLKGGLYDVLFFNADGTLLGKINGANLEGFTAKIWAVTKGLPDPSNLAQLHKLVMYFQDINEFKNYEVVKLDYNVTTDLMTVIPNGLSLLVTAYDGSSATASIKKRCGDGIEGLSGSDFEIVATNKSGAAISAVTDNGGGSYSISISLAAGEWAKIRVKKGTPVTDVSSTAILSL